MLGFVAVSFSYNVELVDLEARKQNFRTIFWRGTKLQLNLRENKRVSQFSLLTIFRGSTVPGNKLSVYKSYRRLRNLFDKKEWPNLIAAIPKTLK